MCTGSEEVKRSIDQKQTANTEAPQPKSNQKPKILKCKKCDFTCETKPEFWDHIRIHIHPSKMLFCGMCNFVTDLKHHLEYHQKNHTGHKPFKCDECGYTCNNKSMLTSHKKSHSEIYQYHCQDCNYASKYCHQLKLHCKRYAHKPAMVLNPDGTPNPYPFVDVYGTKRGPKMKPGPSKPPAQSAQPIQHPPVIPQVPMPFVLPITAEMLPLITLYYNYLQQNRFPLPTAACAPPPSPPSTAEDSEGEVLDLRKPEKKLRESLENNNNNNCKDEECPLPSGQRISHLNLSPSTSKQ